MLLIISGIITFVLIVLLLTFAITLVESKLVNKGEVTIQINDDESHSITTEAGSTLLSTLNDNGILIPSGCGGAGTCGVCKCQVLEGGGDLLPTEEAHVNRKEAKEHVRLSCQVKVRENMKIHIPDEIFNVKKWECEVISNQNVATYIKEFTVKLPEGEKLDFKPGGYIQIDVPKYDINFGKDFMIEDKFKGEWESFKMFKMEHKNSEETSRAYSMANYPAEGDIVKLNIRIASPPWDRDKNQFMNVPPGICSTYVFSCKPGDKVTISGPFGEFFINDSDSEMVYIGGGAGMAPMRSHIMHLFKTLKTGRKVSFWYGARSSREIFYYNDFKALADEFPNFTFTIALSEPLPEDNWDGPTGFIHQVVQDNYLINHDAPEDIEYYLCGPPVMISAVNDMLYNLGVDKEMIRYDEF